MYEALKGFGFAHGRILEPACGIGHFIGAMPNDLHESSQITAIEIDSITARIAKALYPDSDVRNQPFEEARLADGFYDVAISNIPFGDYRPYDPKFQDWKFPVHDYFFAKAIDKVREGGLVMFITSRGTLDKIDSGLREYISSHADLLGSIRLPNDTFKKNANTEVTTDIVMLQKRPLGALPSGFAWKELRTIRNSLGESIAVNEYFATNSCMMLGEMRLEGRMYQRGERASVSHLALQGVFPSQAFLRVQSPQYSHDSLPAENPLQRDRSLRYGNCFGYVLLMRPKKFLILMLENHFVAGSHSQGRCVIHSFLLVILFHSRQCAGRLFALTQKPRQRGPRNPPLSRLLTASPEMASWVGPSFFFFIQVVPSGLCF